MSDPFDQDEFLIRRKVFTFLGKKFHVYDASGNVILFSKQKAFKLRGTSGSTRTRPKARSAC